MLRIIVRKKGLDTNGNMRWLYQFVDTDRYPEGTEGFANLQREFNCFGRTTKRGITTQNNPRDMQKILSIPFASQSLSVSHELTKAQKAIDVCNSRRGCNVCCSSSTQAMCKKLNYHSELISKINYLDQFFRCQIEVIE